MKVISNYVRNNSKFGYIISRLVNIATKSVADYDIDNDFFYGRLTHDEVSKKYRSDNRRLSPILLQRLKIYKNFSNIFITFFLKVEKKYIYKFKFYKLERKE